MTSEVEPEGAQELPIRPVRKAYEQIADQLREMILSGRLASGHRFPPEAELAQQFGVSRGSMREALRLLSSEGLISTTRGSGGGTVVAAPTPGAMEGYLTGTLALLAGAEAVSVGDLLQIREFLEVPAAAVAASNQSPDLVAKLQRCIPEPGQRLVPQDVFAMNLSFHDRIISASGNPLLEIMAKPLFTTLQTRFLRERATQEFWAQVVEDHRSLHAAIKAGDVDAATKEMTQHLKTLRSTYEQIDRSIAEERA